LPKRDAYKEWRRFVIRRLTKFYPLTEETADEEALGPPVPRAALDPSFDYRPELARDLLANFLRSCDPGKNPYLRSPKEMLDAGFEGVPYAL
jgi:hypothetical protein